MKSVLILLNVLGVTIAGVIHPPWPGFPPSYGGAGGSPSYGPNIPPAQPDSVFTSYGGGFSQCWDPFWNPFGLELCDPFGFGGVGELFGPGVDSFFGGGDATAVAKTTEYKEGEIIGDLLQVVNGLIFLEGDILLRDERVDDIIDIYDNTTEGNFPTRVVPARPVRPTNQTAPQRRRRSLLDRLAGLAEEEEDFLEEDWVEEEEHSIEKRSVIWKINWKWPNVGDFYKIPYYIQDIDASTIPTFNEAVKHIQDNSKIRFERQPTKPTVGDYVTVYNGIGCHSELGRIGKGEQLLSLQNINCNDRGTIIHELLHTIGFLHEQSRNDRNKYVNIKRRFIENEDLEIQFKRRVISLSLGSLYDFNSIMHYPLNAFSIDTNDPTKRTLEIKSDAPDEAKAGVDPSTIGMKNAMSQIDIEQLKVLYP